MVEVRKEKSMNKQTFSTQHHYCLTFSLTEPTMLLRCCLIQVTVFKLTSILYLEYLCPCLGLGLFILYLWDLFFISSPIFIVINHIILLKQTNLFFVYFFKCLLLFLDDNMDEESEQFWNSKSSVSGWCLAFAWLLASSSLTLIIKMLLIEKACI